MNVLPQTLADIRQMTFPLVAGETVGDEFVDSGVVGTGFFVGRHGLALTAAHVARSEGMELRPALFGASDTLVTPPILWRVLLPGSDLAVMRLDWPQHLCFPVRFASVQLGEDVVSWGVPAFLFQTDRAPGHAGFGIRCLKGYVTTLQASSAEISFALPKGMSGAPLLVNRAAGPYVAGALVGQRRGEQFENLVSERTEPSHRETHIYSERVDRFEYTALCDLLEPYGDFTAPEFEGRTLAELTE